MNWTNVKSLAIPVGGTARDVKRVSIGGSVVWEKQSPYVPATFVDGEYWNTLGVATALSGASRCDDFIPVQPSSTVTFYLGARPGGTTLYMVQYNANKERVNSTYNANGAARTVTIPSNCNYIRVSAETAKKNEAYIHDDTNNKDLLRNGMVAV